MIAPGQATHGGARAQKPGLFLPHHLSFSSSNLDGSGLPSIPEDELETEGIPRTQRQRVAGGCPGITGVCPLLHCTDVLAPWDIAGVPQVSALPWDHQRPNQMPGLWTGFFISVPTTIPSTVPSSVSPHSLFGGSSSFCLFIHRPQTYST